MATMKLPHEQLADDLMQAGLAEMSMAARAYRYHDFKSPLDLPSLALANELQAARKGASPDRQDKIAEIYRRHMNGEYDATKAESDEWAAGPEGQDVFRRLARGD